MTTTALTDPRAQVPAELQEKVLIGGDLRNLTIPERLSYYKALCDSIGLNPLSRPFEYLVLGKGADEKMILYARKDCTDQLRDLHGISVEIVSRDIVDGVIVVTAKATDQYNRKDESIGAVPVVSENGEWKTSQSGKHYFQSDGTFKPYGPLERANAFMKAETKAKRRVTLSICGLGMFDESEIEGVTDARKQHNQEGETPAPLPTGAEMEAKLDKKMNIDEQDAHDAIEASSKKAKGSVLEPTTEEVMEDLAGQTMMGNPQDYISKLKICESVREASQVGNEAEADKHLSHEDLLIIRKAVKARMVELGKKA